MTDAVPTQMFHVLMNLFLLGQESSEGVSWTQMWVLAAVVAVLVIPFVIGSFVAKSLKMPTYATRIGVILLAIVASAVVLATGEMGYGVDLRGGTILVYELDPKSSIQRTDEEGGQATAVTSADIIPALRNRINPSGTLEIVLRPYGDRQLEIIIPSMTDAEVEAVQRQIVDAGILMFAIVATREDHETLIELARDASTSGNRQTARSRTVTDPASGRQLGFWADVDRQDAELDGVRPFRVDVSGSIIRDPGTGQFISVPPAVFNAQNPNRALAEFVESQGYGGVQVLMVYDDKLLVTGEDLDYVSQGYDQQGSPSVRFGLDDSGGRRFYALTVANQPVGSRKRQLGIVLDNRLLSAPVINSPIRDEGTIEGNFTQEETEYLIRILRAGQLPAALNKVPISVNKIGSTLGTDTIRKGVTAIGISLAAVLIFVLFYYRFAGVVACFALILNLLMILASMILINQPITLPGLAGLVLTVGMSVDANVLIFERIREEVSRGSAARMAVRNGFARATTTIIDANLTTLITAIVLYAIGTDQIRGFAVTLILGILFSMFTAIYVSRTLFDIAERRGFLSLGMSDLVTGIRRLVTGNRDFDFMSKGTIASVVSVVLIVIGVAGIVLRGREILDIDFAGGSSVTFQLQEPLAPDAVRTLVGESLKDPDSDTPVQFTLNRVAVENVPDNTVYKVDAAFQDDQVLKDRLNRGFAASDIASLVTYQVEISPSANDPAGNSPADANAADPAVEAQSSTEPAVSGAAVEETSSRVRDNGIRLVALQEEDETEPAPADSDAVEQSDAQVPAEATEDTAPAVETEAVTAETEAAPTGDTEAAGATVPSGEVISESVIRLSIDGSDQEATINYQGLVGALLDAAERAGVVLEESDIQATPIGEGAEDWTPESNLSFSAWRVAMGLEAQAADQVMAEVRTALDADPVWLSSSEISGRVAEQMIGRAMAAIFASLLFIIGYIWFRFQRVAFGVAAVVALVHDVLITVGAIAVSYWLADYLGFLLVDQFKISLTVVAALLTIIGYSLNDTIVIFDRIREIRGKSPRLTSEMINTSVNATLSRTLLTSLTTLIVVVLLYFLGGAGIHAFAFSLVIGVIAGTYSSVFIAAPILLWLINRNPTVAR